MAELSQQNDLLPVRCVPKETKSHLDGQKGGEWKREEHEEEAESHNHRCADPGQQWRGVGCGRTE